jgi:hypothetical protein
MFQCHFFVRMMYLEKYKKIAFGAREIYILTHIDRYIQGSIPNTEMDARRIDPKNRDGCTEDRSKAQRWMHSDEIATRFTATRSHRHSHSHSHSHSHTHPLIHSHARKLVLVFLVEPPGEHLARVRLLLLHRRILDLADVVPQVKLEQRAGLAARPGHDELVEGVVVGEDQILFDVAGGVFFL